MAAGSNALGSVQGRRFASTGLPADSQFQVNTYTTFDQGAAEVAMADAGDFVVVWNARDDANGYIYYNVQAQRYASDGSPAGSQFRVNNYLVEGALSPSVSTDSPGHFVVVWSYSYLYGQRFDTDGLPMGDHIIVDDDGWPNGLPSVAMSPAGEFVVVWHDNDPYGTDTWGWRINAQRYDSFGTVVAGPFQINTYTTENQRHPAVAIDDAGGFMVAWESGGSGGTDADGLSIQRTGASIFADGFESGDTSAWQ